MNICRMVAFRFAKAAMYRGAKGALFRGAKGDDHFCVGRKRAGFSLLEFEVALTLLGIGLVGLFPLVVMQSRAVHSIENRLSSHASYYLVASPSVWRESWEPRPNSARRRPRRRRRRRSCWSTTATTATASRTATGRPRPTREPSRDNSASTRCKNGPPDTATWQFSGLAAGWFQFQTTWLASPGRSTRAVYTGYDGSTTLGTDAVNQQAAPSGTTFDGCAWQTLATLWLNGPTASVSLAASSDGSVAADAARLVPLLNSVQVLSLDRAINGQEVTVRVQVNAPGSP